MSSRIDCASGTVGAPMAPCTMRQKTRLSSDGAKPHISVETMKPATHVHMVLRRPKRATSQPVIGVAMAMARILKVTIQETSSGVADMAPWICGSTVDTTRIVVK